MPSLLATPKKTSLSASKKTARAVFLVTIFYSENKTAHILVKLSLISSVPLPGSLQPSVS